MKSVIVCGTRTLNQGMFVKYWLDYYYKGQAIEVISGGAPGADRLGELWANSNKLPVKVVRADWQKHGKAAGPIRNKAMALMANECIAFWDGQSRGTANMIKLARENGLVVHVIKFT